MIPSLPVPIGVVNRRILLIRGQKVILDADLAELYGVQTKMLNRAIKRNPKRFPSDFMFQLATSEVNNLRFHFGTSNLRSQIATSKKGHGGRRYQPYAFTEHGALMAANVLKSSAAIQVSIEIVRAFVKLREIIDTHKGLSQKLDALENKYSKHDQQINAIFAAIRELMKPTPVPQERQIGFRG